MYNLLFGKESQVACHLVRIKFRSVERASDDGTGTTCVDEIADVNYTGYGGWFCCYLIPRFSVHFLLIFSLFVFFCHRTLLCKPIVSMLKCRDLEIGVRGHSRSLKVAPFGRSYMGASAVVIHYEEALYQVYAPLPLCTLCSSY